jgi:hypothetical protein
MPQKAELKGDILGEVVTKLNTGIAIVVPAHVIADLIENAPELKEARERRFLELAQQQALAAPDLDGERRRFIEAVKAGWFPKSS